MVIALGALARSAVHCQHGVRLWNIYDQQKM